MQEEFIQQRISLYNKYLLTNVDKVKNLGLFHGKMGLCIYFYMQSKLCLDKEYEKVADQLLESVYSDIGKCKDIGLENGITGIGIGINFLLECGLCEGNPNIVLEEIDNTIFRTLCKSINIQGNFVHDDICKCLYFCMRMKNSRLSSKERLLFSELLVHAFNRICNNMSHVIHSEPSVFSPFGYSLLLFLHLVKMMEELRVYDYKIRRALKEWKEKIQTVFPTSIGHRYLLYNMVSHMPETLSPHLDYRCDILQAYTHIDSFFYSEMKDMQLSLGSGASGLWLFMKIQNISDSHMESLLINKIRSSCIWAKKDKEESELINDSLFMGLPGIILIYQKLHNNHE